MRGAWNAVVMGLLVVALAATSFYYGKVDPIQNHMKLGLDLKGGVHMVLQGVDSEVGKVTPEAIQKAKSVIDNRVNKLGVSEPLVQIDGNNRIIVELAGVQNTDEARDMIGKTAVLKFIDPDTKEAALDGKDIEKAGINVGQNGSGYVVTLKLKGDGTKKFADITTKLAGTNKPLAIMLDDDTISAPVVSEPITTGEAIIRGNFTAESAQQLADLINGGALPVKLELKENRVVSATLGMDSLAKSAKAGIIGMVAILVFMILMYGIPGILANLALIIYTMLTIGFLIAINGVFTLPGMAGLLLSIGMAVDGNIIIFERIKEELRLGKGLRSGIDAGFHRAYAAIIDGQVTTALAGGVLWYLGTGPIKGFALTLVVGVLLSIFTSVTVSRWLINMLVNTGWVTKRVFGIKEVAQ